MGIQYPVPTVPTAISRYRPVSTGIDRYRPVSTGSDRQRPVSPGIDRYRPVSTAIDRHRPVSTGSNRYRPVIDRYRPVSTGIDRYRPVSCYLPASLTVRCFIQTLLTRTALGGGDRQPPGGASGEVASGERGAGNVPEHTAAGCLPHRRRSWRRNHGTMVRGGKRGGEGMRTGWWDD